MKRRAVRADESTEQLDPGRMKRAEVEVVAAVVARGLRVADKTRRRRGELVRGAIEEAGLPKPPDDVPTANAAGHPRASTAGEEDLPPGLVQLLGQLASGLAAADDQHIARAAEPSGLR